MQSIGRLRSSVYNDGINVATEDNGDGGFVFPLSRFA